MVQILTTTALIVWLYIISVLWYECLIKNKTEPTDMLLGITLWWWLSLGFYSLSY